MSKEALKLALKALKQIDEAMPFPVAKLAQKAIREALVEQPAQVPVKDNTYGYAKSLAEAIFKQHFASDEHYASGRIVWGVNDTVIGMLTQIDNMVADMVRRPAQQQQEPVAWRNAALRVGEDLCSVGPFGYYDMTAEQWLNWALSVVTVHAPPASKPWVELTDEEIGDFKSGYQSGRIGSFVGLLTAIEAKLREKNT